MEQQPARLDFKGRALGDARGRHLRKLGRVAEAGHAIGSNDVKAIFLFCEHNIVFEWLVGLKF